ncbi:TVG0367712 [Thermoplasma volcanium GSS1]|uniref:TVG0367712 protein n=1 Tax=Thermoplasma volcanium (strain ATCC 51530 / DSM 4299 / JCM 9571 / NBRC 15438 / GSS1) TaxID=273116 RepID=Q97BS7_THEVO|nr:hypothetical protein [Thermoplasma volcanium]BAB59520.1 TVG0367712 [Thermoplasma volcanium GSS1]
MNRSVLAVYSIAGIQFVIAIILWILAVTNPTGNQRIWSVVFAIDLILSGIIAFIIMRPEMEVN